MNRDEALALLHNRIKTLRALSYTELLRYLNNATADEVIASSGQTYQIEVEAIWADRRGSDLLVVALIDDGSLRWATCPLVQDFIIRPDGTFVGE